MADRTELTINDFPAEILERFVPDLRPHTISTLRLVSQRFSQVFSADRYFRRYLQRPHCPELYLGDAEIGEVDRWWKCLAAEKLRLENWKSGKFARVDTVELPTHPAPRREYERPFENFEDRQEFTWRGMKDEKNEQWMIREQQGRKIILLNITDKPMMSVHDVSAFASKETQYAHLLPGQVMIEGLKSWHVFNLEKSNGKVSIRQLFDIERIQEYLSFEAHSGKSSLTGAYKSWCMFYNKGPTHGVLHVWDVKGAVQEMTINLMELLSHKCNFSTNPDFHPIHKLKIVESEFPIVAIIVEWAMKYAIAVVNIEDVKLVYWLGDVRKIVSQCVCNGHMACVLSHCQRNPFKSTVIVYDFGKRSITESDKAAVRFRYETEAIFMVNFKISTLIIREFPCFTNPSANKIKIVCFDGPNFSHREVNLNLKKDFSITRIIHPFFMVMNKHRDSETGFSFVIQRQHLICRVSDYSIGVPVHRNKTLMRNCVVLWKKSISIAFPNVY